MGFLSRLFRAWDAPQSWTSSSTYSFFMVGSTVILPLLEVWHIPGLGFDGLVGYSPIAMAKNAIGMAIACEEYGMKFLPTAHSRAACWSIWGR